jgi:hypothetical protein
MKQQSVVRISLVVFIAVAVGLGFWAVPRAFAENGPCKEDMAKYCKDVKPGEGRIIKCMKEHEKDLSPGCKAKIAEMKEKRHEAREECKDDVVRFCGNVKPGEGRIIHCLKEHENDLTPQCKAKLESHHHKKAE